MFPLPCGKDVTEKNSDMVIASDTPKWKKRCIKRKKPSMIRSYSADVCVSCNFITSVFCSVSHSTSEALIQQCLASVRTMNSADGLSDGWKLLAPSHTAEV